MGHLDLPGVRDLNPDEPGPTFKFISKRLAASKRIRACKLHSRSSAACSAAPWCLTASLAAHSERHR